LIRILDEEIQISPREFTVEAGHVAIAVGKWKRQHPGETLTAQIVYDILVRVFSEYWGAETAGYWADKLGKVAERAVQVSGEKV
jgi:hypothetical protein